MRLSLCLAATFFSLVLFCGRTIGDAPSVERPNVLFISIDDLNDWAGPFGGHRQAVTPNLDQLAKRGAVVFQNAHCPGPVCGPSRSALLSGFMPHHSGVYGNAQNMLSAPLVQTHATMPEYFAKHGYHTLSRGKIFHAHVTSSGRDRGQWAFEQWENSSGGFGVDRQTVTSRDKNLINGKPGPKSKFTKPSGSEFAWGVTKGGMKETSDYRTAAWAADQLGASHDKPFFMAVGLSKPHLPFYCPREFYDLYPLDQVKANPFLVDDLDDILKPNGSPKFLPSKDYLWLAENELLEEVTQAYLACVSYADACIGVILDGLEQGPHRDNTIVVLWGDHGWHLGEKLRYRKGSGWIESTRLPLVIRTPVMRERIDCNRPVNLIDLYPTLIDYCGLPPKPEIDGRSLVPLLKDATKPWNEASVTIFGRGNASIVGERWHYIRYSDGTEELYDLDEDPLEWNNLAANPTPTAMSAKERLGKHVPTDFAPQLAKPATDNPNTKSRKQGKEIDQTLKATRSLGKLK